VLLALVLKVDILVECLLEKSLAQLFKHKFSSILFVVLVNTLVLPSVYCILESTIEALFKDLFSNPSLE
jgi:hypothetical protein